LRALKRAICLVVVGHLACGEVATVDPLPR
jgi:hypothetical protein